MDNMLSRLLIDDDDGVFEQAKAELNQVFENLESTGALFQLIISSECPMIRQYAAILLRKRYCRQNKWFKLPENVRTDGKDLILQGLVKESETIVTKAIAQLIGAIMKHEMIDNSWPQVLQVIEKLITKGNSNEKELGIYTLATITEVAPSSYLDYVDTIISLLIQTSNSLEDTGSSTAFYLLQTMLKLVPLIKDNEDLENAYKKMMPQAMSIVPGLAIKNEERATASLELFDELCQQVSNVVRSHVDELVALCLTIAKDDSFGEKLRFRALSLLETLILTRKKCIVEHKLARPIVELLYELMSTKPDEDCFSPEHEEQIVVERATKAMLCLARQLKPEEITPLLLEQIKSIFDHDNPYGKKTSYLALVVLAEECSEYIKQHHLSDFFQYVLLNIDDEYSVARYAALHAAGHFSKSLQPEISRYCDRLLPILWNYLDRLHDYIDHEKGVSLQIDMISRSLDAFWAFRHRDCIPYLPTVMHRLIEYLNKGTSPQMRLIVIRCIGEAAKYGKEDMLPYFPDVVDHLLPYLTVTQPAEIKSLQLGAIKTLGYLLRYIRDEQLIPVLNHAVKLGINLIEQTMDSDIKCAVYNLFTDIIIVWEKNIADNLEKILIYFVASIRKPQGTDDGVKISCPNNEDDSDNDSEDEGSIQALINRSRSIGNAATLMESEKAMINLRTIAQYAEEAFLPYYENCFEIIIEVIDSPHKQIWLSAILTSDEFCVCLSRIDSRRSAKVLMKILSGLMPKYSKIIRRSKNGEKVVQVLASVKRLLEEVKEDFGEDHRKEVIDSAIDVWSKKTECQLSERIEFRIQDNDEHADGNNDKADYTDDFYSNARDVVLALQDITAQENFAVHYKIMLAIVQEKLKASNTEEYRSHAVEMIGLCIHELAEMLASFVDQLLAIFYETATDESALVRRQAFRGLRELVIYAKNVIYNHYESILSVVTANEDDTESRGYMIAIIAKMIITNYSVLDMNRVFPSFADEVTKLQFKEHADHFCDVFKSVSIVYRALNEIAKPHLQKLLAFAITVFYEYNVSYLDDSKRAPKVIEKFIVTVCEDYPDCYNKVQTQLPSEIAEYMLTIEPSIFRHCPSGIWLM